MHQRVEQVCEANAFLFLVRVHIFEYLFDVFLLDVHVLHVDHRVLKLLVRDDAIAVGVHRLEQLLQLVEVLRSHFRKLLPEQLRHHQLELARVTELGQRLHQRLGLFALVLLLVLLLSAQRHNPRVLQRLLGSVAILHFELEQLANQVAHLLRHRDVVGEPWPKAVLLRRAHASDEAALDLFVDRLPLVLAVFLRVDVEGRVAVEHHEQDHAHRPDVARVVVLLVADDLGRSVVRRAAEVRQVLQARQHLAHAEVDDLDGRVLALVEEEDVVRLQVAVHDVVLLVHVLQRSQQLLDDARSVVLAILSAVHNALEEFAAAALLHHDEQRRLVLVHVEQLDDVGVRQRRQDINLVVHGTQIARTKLVRNAIKSILVQQLDGVRLFALFVRALKGHTKLTWLAQLLQTRKMLVKRWCRTVNPDGLVFLHRVELHCLLFL
mmetsp:Transcript_36408/g.59846  ORF Transcript_36408/g.59846 Transcript_36408/m.59846 type:complete len:436 (-) Transcript_36408:69-1376(-)